jgi:ribosomal protein S18 acetylase RimI-like enzyme
MHDDVQVLVELYRGLETEQTAIKAMWRLADGLAEPVEASLAGLIDDVASVVVLGTIDDVPLGFMWARIEDLLPQAGGEKVAAIRLVYTDHEARGVGVGEAMVTHVLDELRERGLHLFDAYVSPGHRLAKNFFESQGFSARSIAMHHNDDEPET